ncbi:MAG: PBP1A family penicillin-binding protein [Patescibacteria group bacterium]
MNTAPTKTKFFFKSKIRLRKLWKRFPLYLGYTLIILVLFVAGAFAWFTKDLPTPSKIASRKATESTKLYDRTGEILLYETGEQKRTVVGADQISRYLKEATVATEDANFYSHHGFDIRAVMSAVAEQLTGKTSRTRGGSTITQQYVKNALLNSNRSMTRKIKELILSVELEFMFDKDEILAMYLNEVPYGSNTAGAEAAARTYWGKSAQDLTLAESATLAAIPKAPTFYSPYGTHVKELVNRKNYVLDRMADAGAISEEEAKKAEGEDTTTLGTALKPRRDNILAPHFAMYVLEEIADEYGEERIQKEGLKIITTLDYEKQKAAEAAVAKGADKLSRYGASNAALVAVDPKTGQVLSMIGSLDYFDTEIDGNVNVANSLRQPGSAFKPFAYTTAFKKKEYSPSRIIFDLQTDFGGGYVPQNYNGNFNGPVTMRTALSNSLNIPAVKVLSLAGIDNVLRTAEDMGITTLNQRDRYGLSLVLGAGEVRPVEMASAFGVFAAGGVKHDPISALKITDSKGKILFEYKPTEDIGRKVLDPQIAYEINSILSDNEARSMVFGPRSALYFSNRTVAVKTGTTSDFKDAWTVGYTPAISTAVWVGNSDAAKMKSGADGSVLAGPIFHAFIESALADTPSEEFNRPEGILEVEVEKYSNKLATEHSREKTKDIFASWQIPTEKDDVNIPLRICKGTNKLAPGDLADSLVDIRVANIVKSERPDYPNWEGPVRGWAEANGYFSSVPGEYCKRDDFATSLSITAPAGNSAISGNFEIAVSINSPLTINEVDFYIDGIAIGSDKEAPYTAAYNAATLSAGEHEITAIATDQYGNTNQVKQKFTTAKDSAPPVISGLTVLPSRISAAFSWLTNEESTSQIFYDITPRASLAAYSGSSIKSQVLTTSHAVSLGGLKTNTIYYYRAVSTDAGGNTTASEESTFSTLP